MLISRVPEDDSGRREGRGDNAEAADHYSHEYQTASELFDLMASNHIYQLDGEDETLTNRDLVLIYKNIDLGSNLISNSNEFRRRVSNQYVENVVYEDLDSDSDLSEICSCEDIHNMMLINNERINLLTSPSSFENTICHKFGDINICPSDFSIEYDRNFILKNSLNEQVKSNSKELSNAVLPVSLLDYICCKRLEENYNFDMDNIIRYVKHTIDQLKRISNGDYLTEKVKERWREVNNETQIKKGEITEAKVLANTTSIPLYVERKVTGNSTKWDDLVHSSIDIRSLSKIIEKKIIVEVPKTLCGSYKLFSKCCNDNLIIRCKSSIPPVVIDEAPQESRVDVVVHLNRSKSGHVMSNINSIMIVQKPEKALDILPLLSYDSSEEVDTPMASKCKEDEVTEMKVYDNREIVIADKSKKLFENFDNTTYTSSAKNPGYSNVEFVSSENVSLQADSDYQGYTDSGDSFKKFYSGAELPRNFLPNEDLRTTIQKLNMCSLPEESIEGTNSSTYNKKCSPTRNRIKSPYENKSHLVEEKKRRRLLEVRQMREKNKLALAGCKIKKMKYPIPPQTANSVTKLSITNKSFYNSIYGQSPNMEQRLSKTKIRKGKRPTIPEIPSDVDVVCSTLSPDIQETKNQKYINRSYYLDNTVTEMMYMDINKNGRQEQFSETASTSTNDIKVDFKLLSKYITSSPVPVTAPTVTSMNNSTARHLETNIEENDAKEEVKERLLPSLEYANTPYNTPLGTELASSEKELDENDPKKASTSAEFIKSIDKIYELIHKLGKTECNETKLCKSKFTAVAERVNYNDACGETSTVQCSDSGTSVKHQLTSSNPSCFSFEKNTNVEETPRTATSSPNKKRISNIPVANVVSKVIISAKSQNFKADAEKSKKNRPRTNSANRKNAAENPLKAISQLLHDFENVQKNRNKTVIERVPRKSEVTFNDIKVENKVVVQRASQMGNRLEQHIDKHTRVAPRDRRYKPPVTVQQPILAERPGSRTLKKKVVDIFDEMKEARGEAVRGPCRLNARLNSLAQPKKIYVQAQIEEFQARYGKSIVTDRLQKLTGNPTGQAIELPPKLRRTKNCTETVLPLSKQSPSSHPAVLEKPLKKTFNSNKRDTIPTPNDQCFKQPNVDTRDALKKKIVSTSSEGTDLTSSPFPLPFTDVDLLSGTRKSRASFIPKDIELGSVVSSMDESSTIGNKIRRIIDVMIPTRPSLYAESKNKDVNTNLGKDTANEAFCTKCRTQKQTDEKSNSCENQHDERPLKIKREYIIGDTIPEENYCPQESKEKIVLETENSLCHPISIGSFQKRISHKNLTLTPKTSMQKVLLLQSGDSNSVILQSTISPNIQITKTNDTDFKCLPKLTNFDWSFVRFPVMMPIVEYSFPKYNMHSVHSKVHSKLKKGNSDQISSSTNKTTQCYKGTHVEQVPERLPKADNIKEFLTLTSLFKMSSTVIEEEPEESKCALNEVIPETKNEVIPETKHIKEIIQDTSATKITNLVNLREQIAIPKVFENKKFTEKELDAITKECLDTLSEECAATLSKQCVEQQLSKECADMVCIEYINKTSKECGDDKVSSISSNVDYTASLDVLVGLLNEIKTITTCQSRMTTSEDSQRQLEDMETILKSAAALELVEQEARNIISISSLDKLRQLESNASILSFYLSNNGDKDIVENLRPLYVDKEVNAVMPTEFVNKCTGVPSQFFPLTVSHSTNVSNSLIGILSEPSSHSIFTVNEQPLHSDMSLTCITKIIKIPKTSEEDKSYRLPVVIAEPRAEDESYIKRHGTKVTLTRTNKKFATCEKGLKKNYNIDSDFNTAMKIKRDILVTVYSVLVFTVFAALSFPEILYRA